MIKKQRNARALLAEVIDLDLDGKVVRAQGPDGRPFEMAELAHQVLPQDYRSVNTREARILLLEGAGAVLPPFAPNGEQGRRRDRPGRAHPGEPRLLRAGPSRGVRRRGRDSSTA